MAFNLYYAGCYAKEADYVMMDRMSCRLYSQLNDRKPVGEMWLEHCKKVEPNKMNKLFIDSGAYTAWSKDKKLDVNSYIKYLNDNIDYIEIAACIDNIPGELTRTATLKEREESPLITWENYLYMRGKIADKDKLLPVFHMGEDFKHLENMLNYITEEGKHLNYIGLGGTVGSPTHVKDKWYNTVFKAIRNSKNPKVKIHAFGMTSLKLLEKYPFFSADSTGWIMCSANGGIYTKYGKVAVSTQSVGKPDYVYSLPQQAIDQIEKDLNKYDITIQQCEDDYKARGIANVHFLQDWADNYEFKGNNKYQNKLF